MGFLLAPWSALRAVQPYAPTVADPFSDPGRWQKIAELEGKSPRCMVEDRDGAMWFGVDAGVMRYDGERWRTFTPKDGLVGSAPVVLREKGGQIYAGTAEGISRFSGGRWERVFPTQPDRKVLIYSMIVAADGSVWAGSDGFIVHVLDGKSTVYCAKGQGQAMRKALPEATIVGLPENFAMSDLVEVYETRDGLVWYALLTGELVRFDPTRQGREDFAAWHEFTKADGYLPGTGQRAFFQAGDGLVWIGSGSPESSISRFDPAKGSWAYFNLTQILGVDNLVRSIAGTRDGAIWFGGLARISRYQDGRWQSQSAPELPLPSSKILLHESRAGDLWLVGSGDEVQKIDYRRTRWLKYDGLNFECETPDGRQWFVSVDDGVVSFDGKEWLRYGVEDGLMSSINTLLCTPEGRLWAAGTHDGKAATAWLTGTTWSRKTHEHVQPAFGTMIDYRAAFESADGSLWFGTYVNGRSYAGTDGGILQYDPRLGPPQDDRAWRNRGGPLLLGRSSNGIAQMADGTMYSGSFRGLSNFDGSAWVRTTAITDIYNDALCASRDGKLWVGTRGAGLVQFDGKQVTRITTRDGLISNAITALFCDRDNHLWVGTSKGVSYFDGKEWTTDAFIDAKVSINFEGGGFKQAADGAIWINQCSRSWMRRTMPGSRFNPATAGDFSTIRYLRETVAPRAEIITSVARVAQPGNTLIAWRGVSPWWRTQEDDLRYSQRLDAGPWSRFDADTSHVFLQLPTGRHRVEVRVRDRDLNVALAQVEFAVLPPIWRQPWFVGLMIALAGVVATQATRLFLQRRHLRRSNQALNAEIERRTLMEREIEATHKRLLVVSRQAGMAEIATGVLHNVGNVLNSVNVSATLVTNRMCESQAAKIEKLAALFNQHTTDLADFLTNDSRGRMIPAYVEALAEAVAGEQKTVVAELADLRKNIDHIMDIVAMQQAYATTAGVTETVGVTDMIDDALRIDAAALDRVRVETIRDYRVNPFVSTDKHKVVQILVNLITNARQACEESARSDKKVTLRTTGDERCVRIEVIDNGIGIPPENLAQIFGHGFTTRKGGHGFGLHNSALAAKEIGGTLSVQSAGSGHGATFVLELPLPSTNPAP
ncbi:MAG TPA: two-component regulator propeller domain-containing protein [Bryobacteraceae bacterium]|nr:two-component regulator propeller domain-containing protein [Bryobacteraceae bacterium]